MSDTIIQPSENKKSFDAQISVFTSLPNSEVRSPNADPASIVTEMKTHWPKLFAMRPRLALLYDFDIKRFDSIPEFIAALAYACAVYNMRLQPSSEFLAKVDEAIVLRGVLGTDLQSLVNHKRINVDFSKLPPMTKAYENIVTYLNTYGEFLTANWPAIEGKSAIQASDVNRALSLASDIQEDIGLRAESQIEDAADMRARTFTVGVDTYNDARAAIQYLLRKTGGADEIAPSLFAAQNKSRKRSDDQPSPAPVVQSVATIPSDTSPLPNKAASHAPVLPDGPGGNPYVD